MRLEYPTQRLTDPQYEIYLPLTYNDGKPVEEHKFAQTRQDLFGKFGGLSVIPPSILIEGYWEKEGITYRDQNVIYKILTFEDEDEFFSQYKEMLRERFEQKEIHIVKTPAEKL
ncbi:hypothetical protein ES703_114514 [subsurface metagenome]